MTFLRRYEQFVTKPGWSEIEVPRDFAEQAYAAGLQPGSATVKLYNERNHVVGVLDGIVHGVRVRMLTIGHNDASACEALLTRMKELDHGTRPDRAD